ncbi:hypothetical protein D3C77_349270 [compost metagenome]
MKTVLNNLVWMALFLLMASASVYPSVSPVSQAVIWLFNGILMVFCPLVLLGSLIIEDKEKLQKLAGKNKGFIKKTFGFVKLACMFSAISYAGFTVAAVFYAVCAFLIYLSIWIARDRLEGM